MLITVCLAFAAGFWAGNGLPYYSSGSTGDAVNPGPFGQTAIAKVVIGWLMFVVAGICWYFAGAERQPAPAYAAAAVGVLMVGLIHAVVWRRNPWGRRRAPSTPGR